MPAACTEVNCLNYEASANHWSLTCQDSNWNPLFYSRKGNEDWIGYNLIQRK